MNGVVTEDLRPKCYSLLYNGEVRDNVLLHTNLTEKQTAKGTKKSTKKKHLRHINYMKVRRNLTTEVVTQNIIRSKSHKLSSYHVNKVSHSAFDTKSYICSDNVHTLAHGTDTWRTQPK